MLDIISFGSATEDVFVHVPKTNFGPDFCVFRPGTKIDIENMEYFIGGGATNTAVGFSRFGLKAGAVFAIGDDESGATVLKELRKEKVDTKNALVVKGKKTSYSVILTGFGRDRVILVYCSSTAMLNKIKIDWKKIKAKWFYVSSLHAEPKMLKEIARHAKKINAKVAFNPGQKELELGIGGIKNIFGKVNILILNNHEAMKLTGSADIKRNLAKLLEIAEVVVITEGQNGAHASDGNFVYSIKPYEVNVVDSTGAGDAFGCGFVGAFLKGKNVEDCMKFGTANACSVIMYLGTKNKLLRWNEVPKFIKEHSKNGKSVEVQKL